MKKLLAFVLMFIFAFVLVGCGEKSTPTDISITGEREVGVGQEITLTAKVTPDKADQAVTWSSNLPSIAAVDATTGKVTGISVGGAIITAKSTVNGIEKQHVVQVKEDQTVVYPDMGGYTIRIAHSVPRESDPFHEDYNTSDKEARKQAWDEVEKLYKVNFEVTTFPETAPWGPPRWNYIIDEARANTTAFDFVSVPDDKIGEMVEGNALQDVTDWYPKYGQGFLDPLYQKTGTYKDELYSIIDGVAGINNAMFYNVNLVNTLIEQKHLTKTPAQLFNEGLWTYDAFVEYAIAAQAGLKALYPDNTDAFAVSGYSMYYLVGMTNAGGVALTDPTTKLVNFTTSQTPQDAAAALKAIADAGAMRKARTVDGLDAPNSFTKGVGVFDSGDMWFVRTSTRYSANMWGEDTKYGYVPFPRPNEMKPEDQKIAMGGTATYVMPKGRSHAYAGFGETNAENIYRAFTHTFLLTEQIRKEDPTYSEKNERTAYAERFTDSEDSKEALLYMYDNLDTMAFWDPWSLPTNPVANTYNHAVGSSFHGYIVGTGVATYVEAFQPYLDELQQNLTKAYNQ